jgi:hypothetical protein
MRYASIIPAGTRRTDSIRTFGTADAVVFDVKY